MRYVPLGISFQEVPNEISLVLAITGCPRQCPGCHTPKLQDKSYGEILDITTLQSVQKHYADTITCVCIFGGELHIPQLTDIVQQLQYGTPYKFCWYNGMAKAELFSGEFDELLQKLDYVKYGPYIAEAGGLDSPTTNQVFLDLKLDKPLNHLFRNEIRGVYIEQ